MAFSGSQTTALNTIANPGPVRTFVAKTESRIVFSLGGDIRAVETLIPQPVAVEALVAEPRAAETLIPEIDAIEEL